MTDEAWIDQPVLVDELGNVVGHDLIVVARRVRRIPVVS
jgi:hypothetical protein